MGNDREGRFGALCTSKYKQDHQKDSVYHKYRKGYTIYHGGGNVWCLHQCFENKKVDLQKSRADGCCLGAVY